MIPESSVAVGGSQKTLVLVSPAGAVATILAGQPVMTGAMVSVGPWVGVILVVAIPVVSPCVVGP